jgi:hypothetical protein
MIIAEATIVVIDENRNIKRNPGSEDGAAHC